MSNSDSLDWKKEMSKDAIKLHLVYEVPFSAVRHKWISGVYIWIIL